jgi:amidase
VDISEYRSFDAVGLAGLVASRQVQPGELLDAALQAVDEAHPFNAVVDVFEDLARQAIVDGLPAGPLRGVPFALKDLWTRMAGTVTSNASRLFSDDIAQQDSEIVARFRRAGLVIFAKTNSAELGLSPTTEPALFGATANPWASTYSAGGSSGGAASAVAAGILPIAHATDGGGSIRIPASACGLFGLKPTRGRVPFGPERGEGWGGMSAQHVVSRSVRDSAAVLDAISGAMPGDPYAPPPSPESYLDEAGLDPGRLRIAICWDPPGGEPVDAQCVQAAAATARRCETLGHDIVEFTWPFSPEAYTDARFSIVAPYVALAVDRRLESLGRKLHADDLEPFSAMICELGRNRTAVEYAAGVQAMHEVGRGLGQAFERVDVLLTPTMARPPIRLGELATANAGDAMQAATAFTVVANISGQPAMSIPLDRSESGLPLGTQFVGRFGDETTLLRLAAQLEKTHPWPLHIAAPQG